MLSSIILGVPLSCLVKLPKSFVELYSMVNRVKGRDSRTDDAEDDSGFETAICLLTGAVMRSGTVRRMKQVSVFVFNTLMIMFFSSLDFLPLFSVPAIRIAPQAHVQCTQERLDLGLAFFF